MNRSCAWLVTPILLCCLAAQLALGADPRLDVSDGQNRILLGERPVRVTSHAIAGLRSFDLPEGTGQAVLWNETEPNGAVVPWYAISPDGVEVATARATSYEVALRAGRFDPLLARPSIASSLRARSDAGLYLVQFRTQPFESYRRTIAGLGGTVGKFVAHHAQYVRMTPEVRDAVAALPFVRWVGPVHPQYKLEEEIRDAILAGAAAPPRRYSIMLHERGTEAQARVVGRIEALGGQVNGTTPRGFRVEATLSLSQVRAVAGLDDVQFVDRKGPLERDMDIVREIGGANYLETVAGFTGQGVRAEVADSELDVNHPEWGAPPIVHVAGADVNHGTSVYGILFAQGVDPQARGLIPDGVGIFAYSTGLLGGGTTRYTHTAELVDPNGPYRTVLQTNSTGDPRTTQYTTISAEMDDILFLNDIAITQSQSNAGNQDSRPQAWAKNIISGGAVEHYDTATRSDDCWCNSGSVGPAADGRIKPDLCFFYDSTYTTTAGGGYTQFGGTSGATPSIAGHLGLFFQMWSEQTFGNDVPNPGGTVFENRPHMTTAKAALINTASAYDFTGPTHDLTRVHQGWGIPSVQALYDARNKIGFIDETEVLQNMETAELAAFVNPGEPALRVTMVYADPMGSPSASIHRVNDLSLRVTSPSGAIYWGNSGLLDGNWSVAGGSENHLDTVENVFVQDPEAGLWTVEVIASEVNEDGHLETPEIDADFALVVSGADLTNCTSEGRIQLHRALYACDDTVSVRVVDCDLNTDDAVVDTVTVTVASLTEPGGETLLLTETAPSTADFRATIPLATANGPGVLQVGHADVVTASYLDADDGQGGTDVTVQDSADLDCSAPVISNVQATGITGRTATIAWDTDEPADGRVAWADSLPPVNDALENAGLLTAHSLELKGLDECTVYAYSVSSTDVVGNSATSDNNGQYFTFATGVDNQPGFDAVDTPIAIPDNDPTGATSTLTVTDDDTILDVDVRVHVSHTYDGDLTLTLVAPDGTRVALSNRRGGSGNDFVDTVFDDEAATPIASGSAPFNGSFRPDAPLDVLDGMSSIGDWQLEVVDSAGVDTGNIEDWTLILTFAAQQCGPVAVLEAYQLEFEGCVTGSAGAGNGLWEAGEQLEFSLTVMNDGTDPITAAKAVVTALTPGVTMADDTALVGTVAPGLSASTQAPHLIATLDESVACGTPLDFMVEIRSPQGAWPASFQQIAGEVIAERSGVVLSEGFNSGLPPTWSIVDGSADGATWFSDNAGDPGGCGSPDPAAPLAGNWAAIDSSCAGGGTRMDEELISPPFDLTGEATATLEFDHWFAWDPARRDEVGDVDVRSSATGGAWVNVGRWTGASTGNPEHATIDITPWAAGAPDVQLRWHYYESQADLYWYVDNVQVRFLTPSVCNMAVCAAPTVSPSPVSDGGGGLPVQVDRLTVDGSELLVTWDDQCGSAAPKIVWGDLAQVSGLAVGGAVCNAATPQSWTGVPAGDLWFLLIGDDGAGSESSWGHGAGGERNGLQASGTCGATVKDVAGTCP